MELLLLAVILTIFLALIPVRSKSGHELYKPAAAVWRHIDIDELRNAPPHSPRAKTAEQSSAEPAHRLSCHPSMPTIEEDHVETLVYRGQKLLAIARGDQLFLRQHDECQL